MRFLRLARHSLFFHSFSPYIILYLSLFIFHLFMDNSFADDLYFCNVIADSSIWAHTVNFYSNWSARTLIELMTICVGALPLIVWQMINPALATFIAFAINSLLNIKSRNAIYFTCALVFVFPWAILKSAGWVTTCMVYICPLAAFMGICLLYKQAMLAHKTGIWSGFACFVLSIYAFNMEQVNVLALLGIIFLFAVLFFVKKRPPAMLYVTLFCSIANFAYSFACPGTTQRFLNEIITRNKTFNMLTIFQKIEQGFSVTMRDLIFNGHALVILCTALILICVFIQYKELLYRGIASLLALISCVLPILGDAFSPLVSIKYAASINVANATNATAYIPLAFFCIVFLAFLLCIYLALGHGSSAVLALGVFISSVASRVALGLSPTLVASEERTSTVLLFGLVVLCAMLLSKLVSVSPQILPSTASFSSASSQNAVANAECIIDATRARGRLKKASHWIKALFKLNIEPLSRPNYIYVVYIISFVFVIRQMVLFIEVLS